MVSNGNATSVLAEPALSAIEMSLSHTGGFTLGHDGKLVDSGYAVSLFPELSRVASKDWWLDTQLEEIQQYAWDYQEYLAHPRVALGGWVHDGVLTLDMSVICHTKEAADHLARKYHQLAYYDITKREEVNLTFTYDELKRRLGDVPEPELVKAYHLSRTPVEDGILHADRRGENGHEEADRLRLGGAPGGVCLYFDGAEAERPIKHRLYKSEIEAYLALADISDAKLMRRFFEAVGNGPTNGPERLNWWERTIKEWGYDGYYDESGRIVVFNDVEVKSTRRVL